MGPTSNTLEALQAKLLEVRRRIVLRELELECRRILSDRYTQRSDLGWLFSIAASAGGTVLAVLNGIRAGQHTGEATALEQEQMELLVDRKILEHRIAERVRGRRTP